MKLEQYLCSLLVFGMLLTGYSDVFGQRPHDESDLEKLREKEMELHAIGDSMKDGSSQAKRVQSLKKFIPAFIEALKIPGSFDYPFDSLNYVFTFTPADRSFRLYNWHIDFVDNSFRFYGAIQRNNKDSLELTPLYDRVEDALMNAEDTVLGQEGWYGAQYYKLIQKNIDDQKHYFLLGWDGFNSRSNRKIIDVLTFDEEGNPKFGAPVFKVGDRIQKRVLFIFSDKATMQMNYDAREDMIIYDNLVPPNERSKGHEYTYIPDGTYKFFKFDQQEGLWIQKDLLHGDSNKKPTDDAENEE